MTEVKKLQKGFRIILTNKQFAFFCDTIEVCINRFFLKDNQGYEEVYWQLYGAILTNFFKKLSEKRAWPQSENNIKMTREEALVIYDMSHNMDFIHFPGYKGMMLNLHKQLFNSL